MKTPDFRVVAQGNRRLRMEIYDVIGPSWAGMIDAKSIARELSNAGEIDVIELHINSPGGSVWEGLAIYTLLKDHKAKVEVVVDGIAMSMASVIAMAGDTVRIPKNAIFMIHNPWTIVIGDERELQRAIGSLQASTKACIAAYVAKSGQSEEQLRAWMDAETYFTGDEAVEAKFADTTDSALPESKVQTKAQVQQLYAQFDFHSLLALSTKELKMPDTKPADNKPPVALTEADVTKAANEAVATERKRVADINALCAKAGKPEVATEIIASGGSVADAQTKLDTIAKESQTPKPLTTEDVNQAAKAAVETERNRNRDITALCAKAGSPELADGFIANGAQIAEVQANLFDALCEKRPPVGDAGGNDPLPGSKDENAKFKKEYAAGGRELSARMSEEDYVAMRRVDEGLDQLTAGSKNKK